MEHQRYCEIISSSIAEIIRISTDDEFRKSCYELMKVSNTNECQMKIHEKMLKIQENLLRHTTLHRGQKRVSKNGTSLIEEPQSKRHPST